MWALLTADFDPPAWVYLLLSLSAGFAALLVLKQRRE
jgi:hypothetical protein